MTSLLQNHVNLNNSYDFFSIKAMVFKFKHYFKDTDDVMTKRLRNPFQQRL